MHMHIIIIKKAKKEKKTMTTRFLVKNEKEAGIIYGMLRDDEFTRISNCFWYEIWENADGDTVEIERDFS